MDLQEWVAANTVEFYEASYFLFDALGDFCTKASCPIMSGGAKFEYLWEDGVNVVEPLRLSAPEYINALYDWIDDQVNNPYIFPQRYDDPFLPNFMLRACKIFRRLFRVYAHVYHSHFDHVRRVDMEPHLSSSFKRFIMFVKHFELLEEAQLAPLAELINHTCTWPGSMRRECSS